MSPDQVKRILAKHRIEHQQTQTPDGLPRSCQYCQIEFVWENRWAWIDFPKVYCRNCKNYFAKLNQDKTCHD